MHPTASDAAAPVSNLKAGPPRKVSTNPTSAAAVGQNQGEERKTSEVGLNALNISLGPDDLKNGATPKLGGGDAVPAMNWLKTTSK